MEEYQEGIGEGEFIEGDLSQDEFADGDSSMGYSEPKPLGGLYALFEDVLSRLDTTKVSNLDKEELGDLGITVRDCNRIALIADTFKHPGFAKFFKDQARIVQDTSMSKQGWFTELFVTSKKFASRETASIANLPQNKKWKINKLFGKNQSQNNQY